uniref:DBIRD complex subunit ZNF326 n=1 Tax=Callorhinchus milii TaxID=7868 RepID=A0A4W3HHF7_CALMI
LSGGSEWLGNNNWNSRDNWKSGICDDYDHGNYGNSRSFLDPYSSRSERYGPYESHDSRSSLDGRDLYRSGYDLHEPGRGRYGDSYADRSESSYRNFGDQYLDPYEGRSQSRLYDNGRSNWDDTYTHSSSMPRGWADSDTGRGNYSSYSSFSSLLSKPSSVGSRGRGMLAYGGNEYGGGTHSILGGQGGGRGRGRELPDYGVFSRHGGGMSFNRGGSAKNAGRGMKRKVLQPNKAAVNKKQKVTVAEKAAKVIATKVTTQSSTAVTAASKTQNATNVQVKEEKDEDFTKDAYEPDAYECFDKNEGKKKNEDEDEEERKKLEARREKQRRRREKNTEKYGEDYRNAFTCSLCKFRTTEQQEIEAHLETPYHKETLEYIGKNIQFDKGAADFLHASMVNKNKKIAARKQQQQQQQEQKEQVQKPSKDVLTGVTSDDQMKRVEAVQCAVCNTYIPFLFHSVQQHLKSNEHINSKKNYHDQVRRESLLTASSMLNNPTVKAKFDLFLKGENPFETINQEQEQEQELEQEQSQQQEEPLEEEDEIEKEQEQEQEVEEKDGVADESNDPSSQ